MSCELGDMPARLPDAGILVKEASLCADWLWMPSWARGAVFGGRGRYILLC